MTKDEIIAALDKGEQVFWLNSSYPVIKMFGLYYITCVINTHCISLCDKDGELNGSEESFYISNKVLERA